MQGHDRAVRSRRALINEDWEQDIALLQDLFREMVVYAEVQSFHLLDATFRWSFHNRMLSPSTLLGLRRWT